MYQGMNINMSCYFVLMCTVKTVPEKKRIEQNIPNTHKLIWKQAQDKK